jgi:hypothetical protein
MFTLSVRNPAPKKWVQPLLTIYINIGILEPLMRASDLPSNPFYSYPYTSSALTNMVKDAEKQLQAARAALWKAKNLLTEFRGDGLWVPGEAVESEDDFEIFHPKRLKVDHGAVSRSRPRHHAPGAADKKAAEDPEVEQNANSEGSHGNDAPETGVQDQQAQEDVEMADVETTAADGTKTADGEAETARDVESPTQDGTEAAKEEPEPSGATDDPDPTVLDKTNGMKPTEGSSKDQVTEPLEKTLSMGNDSITVESALPEGSQAGSDEDEATPPPPRRMTTRAQAQAASNSLDNSNSSSRTRSQSPTTSTFSSNYIDPLYLLPDSAMPDRNFGLSPTEAEETRRLLITYIQKQEEVVRGHEKIFQGLARANRYRKMVLEWCKADGHTGEMSDGEDWYDKEYWGLDEDLRKGIDEEEEVEAAVAGDKGKRRGRR